jgi:hypothetical protein
MSEKQSVQITPAEARKLLAGDFRDRPVQQDKVKTYTEAMIDGVWIDGQVRYRAHAEETEKKFRAAGHKPENKDCDHQHWKFDVHGRYCTCGTVMVDFGD